MVLLFEYKNDKKEGFTASGLLLSNQKDLQRFFTQFLLLNFNLSHFKNVYSNHVDKNELKFNRKLYKGPKKEGSSWKTLALTGVHDGVEDTFCHFLAHHDVFQVRPAHPIQSG